MRRLLTTRHAPFAAAITLLGIVSVTHRVSAEDRAQVELNLHTVKVASETVQRPIVGTGTIFAKKTSKIGPLVEGQIQRVYVDIGERVREGAPLFEMRPDSYRFAYEEAKSALDVAEAQAIEAEPTFERNKKLYNQGNVSQSSYDTARSALAVVRAKIASAKVVAERAKRDLDDTVAHAPYDAVVTARFADEGVYLSNRVPGGNSAIVELQKIDVVTAVVQMPSRELEKLYGGAPVTLYIDGLKDPRQAKISVLNDKVDIATRTLEARIELSNRDYTIKPGLFVRAEIMPKSREAMIIPRETVLGVTGAAHVYALSNGKAVRTPVEVVDFDASRVEILSGLKPGERVLTGADLRQLSDGVEVGEVTDVAG